MYSVKPFSYRLSPLVSSLVAFSRSLLSLLLVVTAFLTIGCDPSREGASAGGRLANPPKNQGRLIVTIVEEMPARLHVKWSLYGERNWASAKVNDVVDAQQGSQVALALSDTSPINDPKKVKGCNIWEYDLTADIVEGEVLWKVTLHGIDGTTIESSHSFKTPYTNLNDIIEIAVNKDTTVPLPASLTLARVMGKPVIFEIAK